MSTTVSGVDLRQDFREVMAAVAAPVAIVTVLHHGRPHGTTVSAFTSLSRNPPSVLVSLDHASALLARIETGSRVGINVLDVDQSALAARFATKSDDKFAGVAWTARHGAPSLTTWHAWVAGTVTDLLETGDHTLVVVGTEDVALGARAPLIYWRRSFGTHAPAASRSW